MLCSWTGRAVTGSIQDSSLAGMMWEDPPFRRLYPPNHGQKGSYCGGSIRQVYDGYIFQMTLTGLVREVVHLPRLDVAFNCSLFSLVGQIRHDDAFALRIYRSRDPASASCPIVLDF